MPRTYFHKLILSKTIQERKLRIPDTFLKKFGSDLSSFVRLSVPDGEVWPIGLVKADGKCWLYENWHKFMERYTIRIGYFLVFKYESNAVFHVYIFNLSASEIDYQSNALSGNRSHVFEEMEEDELGDKLGVSSATMLSAPLVTSKGYHSSGLQNTFQESKLNHINWSSEETPHSRDAKTSHSSDQPVRDMAIQINSAERKRTTDGSTKLLISYGDAALTKKPGRKKRKADLNGQQSAKTPEDNEMRFRFYESASARKRTVTTEERERAINAAKAFEPVNPFCRVVLRPSYLYRGCIMYLPSCFAEKHLNGVSGFIRLQFAEGKQWPVRCLFRGGRAKLSQGWYEFTLENNMGEGDVCVFELVRPRDVVLKVTVFRVLENTA